MNIDKKHLKLITLWMILLCLNVSAQKLVRYDLYVKDTIVTFGGKEKRAIAVNGQIPMPTLTFTEGDIAEIHVHNRLKESTSLHWHGVFLPNKEDGVPFLTQKPIKPGASYTYTFPVIQNGTHWYHSHSGLQEQIGMHGSLIFNKKKEDPNFRKGIDDLPTFPVIISEWTNLKPEQIHRMLATGSDYFAIKKDAVQSYAEAIKEGKLGVKLGNEWKRMNAMDVSDVYYDQFLINKANQSELKSAPAFNPDTGKFEEKVLKGGDKVRLRIANGGASNYFWFNYSGGKITVVANDGNDVEPVEVDRMLIGVSETYDIVVDIPEDNTAYEFLVTPEDRSHTASLFIGNGIRQLQTPLPKLKYFEGMKMMNDMMTINGDMKDMGMKMSWQQMDMNAVMYPEITGSQSDMKSMPMDHQSEHADHTMSSDIITLNYGMLKAPHKTTLDQKLPVRELRFELTGNMNRYVWSMDNKVFSETDKIPVKKGEVLRITLYNNSMMRHPMHLHGFDFRILNGKGEYSPLKNVMDIMPMETNVIEFAANTEGDWFFHCHILYHMMSGMNRVFEVGDYKNPNLPDKKMAYKMLQMESNMWHFTVENDFATNGNDGSASFSNSRWQARSDWRLGYNRFDGYEVETHVGKYLDKMQWFMPFVGFDVRYRDRKNHIEKNLFGQKNTKDKRATFSAGFMYTLPLLVNFQAEMYTDGIVRLQLAREDIPLSKRLRGAFMINTDKEYMAGIKYIVYKNLALSTHYDSDMGWGLGLTINY